MKILQGLIEEAMTKLAEDHPGLSDEQLDRLVDETVVAALPDLARTLEKQLRRALPSKLRTERRTEAAFVRRNRKRWKKSFGELEFMYHIAAEMGSEFLTEWNSDINDDPYMFAALNTLHVKALVTTKEILCLLEGGYADGALARWRTLHETAVFSTLIREAGSEVAERYLATFDFVALKSARQVKHYAERANLQPPTSEELAEMEVRCQAHTQRLGSGLWHEYGWASAWLNIEKPNFLQLEQSTKLDHWRPRYRWASQTVHGGYRPPAASLAMAEAAEACHAIGPSNSGMVDPLQMSAISLAIVVTNFLCNWPNADRVVTTMILGSISNALGSVAVDEEAESMARFRKQGDA